MPVRRVISQSFKPSSTRPRLEHGRAVDASHDDAIARAYVVRAARVKSVNKWDRASATIALSTGPVRLAWPRTPPSHGGNRGSNPLRATSSGRRSGSRLSAATAGSGARCQWRLRLLVQGRELFGRRFRCVHLEAHPDRFEARAHGLVDAERPAQVQVALHVHLDPAGRDPHRGRDHLACDLCARGQCPEQQVPRARAGARSADAAGCAWAS